MSESVTPPVEKPAEQAEKVYKQADVDAITNKVRETEGKKLAEKEAEIEKLRQQTMTEDQKKLEAARSEGAKEYKTKLETIERERGLERSFMDGGLNPKRLSGALAIIKSSIPEATPDEAAAFLKKEYPEFFNKQFGPGDGVSKSEPAEEWTDERIKEVIRNGTYAQHLPEIEKARQRKISKHGGRFGPK